MSTSTGNGQPIRGKRSRIEIPEEDWYKAGGEAAVATKEVRLFIYFILFNY